MLRREIKAMSNNIFCIFTATSLSLMALSAQAYDPRSQAGNSTNRKIIGNDQNRQAISGMSVLGGGPKAVDQTGASNKQRVSVGATASYGQVNVLKKEADKAFQEGLALQKKGSLTAAGDAIRKSLIIRETNFPTSDSQIPVVQEKLAEIWAAMGKDQHSLQMYGTALVSYARFNGPGTVHRVRPLTAMGNIHLKANDFKGACDCYNQAYMLTQRDKGIASPEAMRLRLQLASAYSTSKSYDLSASLYNECFDLQKKDPSLIADKNQLLSSLQDYASVLKQLKRDDDAEKIIAELNSLRGGEAAPDGSSDAKEAAAIRPSETAEKPVSESK